MRLVVRAAEVTGAERLIDITAAHVDSCLYHGEASLDFVARLVDGGAQVSVPTTLNVGAVDLLHPDLNRGDPATVARGRLLMDRYRALGARPTFTCAPYQLADSRPGLGEQVAWGESNAIAFCNSVLGARTNRYGDFLDIAAAITGRVPDAGLHRTDARRATLVLRLADDVPARLRAADALAPVLGLILGRRAGSEVAAIDGLPPGQSEDRLKAIAAAAASSGSVAMFHVVGSTPEASTLDEATHGIAAPTEERDALGAAGCPRRADERRRPVAGGDLSRHAARIGRGARALRIAAGWAARGFPDRVPRFHRPRRPGHGRGARDRRPAPGRRCRAARRHVQLHRSDPAARRRSGDDRFGEVGLLRPRATSARRSSSARPRSASRPRVAGRVVRDDGVWGAA